MNNLESLYTELEAVQDEIDNFDPRDYFTEDDFLQLLNELEPMVTVCGIRFQAGYVLRELDSDAFDQEYANYVDQIDLSNFDELTELVDQADDLQAQIDLLEQELEETHCD